ncbi:calcium-binding protein [Paragemmobacter straminiformis]|uniref:Calcium-binding protein n=1 Tax=Paragemmobacter straminiformis TaxID=2045119 RepID=A0A842IAS1_9RHOB|nr:calcium-binding protein [Gemmobacter straminiformis]MBC2837142.1 calcium-binding protein [Gemmobacter straminiformis]
MEFTRVGVVSGARFGVPLAQASLVPEQGGAGVRVFNPVAAETVRLGLSVSGLAGVTGFTSHGTARVAVTVGGVSGSLATDLVASAKLAAGVALTGYLTPTPVASQAVEVMAVSAGGVDYLVATRPAGTGIEVFRIGADQSLTRVAGFADTAETSVAAVSALAFAQAGGVALVFAGSASENGVSAFALDAEGGLVPVATAGAAQGVPMQGVSCLKVVESGGTSWLVAGAAGSSSLTVFRLEAGGRMVPVDHVVDDLGTRFAGVVALDAVAVGGRVFVVAAGADDGISLLTLLPDGRLVHLASLADSLTTGLANISDLRLSLVGGVLQVLVLSGAEAGLTQLSVDLRNLGAVGEAGTAGDDLLTAPAGGAALAGGAGRDILLDGAGSDTLGGGAGADVFVLAADGTRDVITDFDIAQDRIDLTRWSFFRNAGQLTITATATGAVLRFGEEELELRSIDGRALAVTALRGLDYGAMTRLEPVTQVTLPPPEPLTLSGSAANDTLSGTALAEVLTGLAGDDLLVGGGGADTLYGGAGLDWASYAGLDTALRIDLRAWAEGSPEVADDVVEGVEGFIGTGLGDAMTGGAGYARFDGGAGEDTLAAGAGGGALWGGEGADSLTGGGAADAAYGGAGDDAALGGEGADTLEGGAGNDRLAGGAGADRIVGGEGDDRLDGGDGVDVLLDGAGNDTVFGGAGNETVTATAGNDWLYGDEGNDTLDGGIGNDRLFGGPGADRLVGGAGDDWFEGGEGVDLFSDGAGDDTIYGGVGNESVTATVGNDGLYGEEGNDTLDGGIGNDRLSGGTGADWLIGGEGDDWLDGGEGVDRFSDGAGNDTVLGGAGNESIAATAGNDSVSGGEGDDTVSGGEGDDRLSGDDGRDILDAGNGNDGLEGGSGNDLLSGGMGDDSLWGDAGNDILGGFGGNDRLDGGAGDDVLNAGAGDDVLTGGSGNDRLSASTGRDTLAGGEGDDLLYGLFGDDVLDGGAGSDRLDGGRGKDRMTGGTGADLFQFTSYLRGEVDVITDFEDGIDRLRLTGLGGGTDAARFRGLVIRDVTIDGVDYAQISRGGHLIWLEGVDAADLTASDFLFV